MPRPLRPALCALCLLIAAVPVLAAGQERTISLDDLAELRMIGTFDLEPQGNRAVVTLGTYDFEENRTSVSLQILDLSSGESRALAPHRDQLGSPSWSPDGSRVGFIASAVEGEGAQVFALPMAGGEARQVTRAPEGISGYLWSADGAGVFYTAREPSPEPEGAERHNRSFEVGDHSYLTRSAPRPDHLWYQDLAGGEPRRYTEGAESVAGVRVSPDGRTLALALRPSAETGVRSQQVVKLLDLVSGEIRDLGLPAPTSLRPFSPDGRYLLVARPRGAPSGYSPYGLMLVPVDGGPTMDLATDVDRDMGAVEWLPDGRSFLVIGIDGTRGVMWQVFVDGAPSRRIAFEGIEVQRQRATADGRLVFIGEQPDHPPEIFVTEIGAWDPRQVTDFNSAFHEVSMGRTETVTWDGPDGRVLTGVLSFPPDYREGDRCPLVLAIHGGPMSTSREAWNLPRLSMAAQGWLVFSPNYRGSDNSGLEFQSAVLGDPAEGPARDIMSGVEHLKGLGIVDESRMAVSGRSYGGFMTTWLAAHYDGWTAAVAGAAVTDWFDAYNLADITDYFREGMGGSPWVGDNAEAYRRWSPITYAHQIEAPTLILSNTGDERVPITQSYKLYRALKDNGVPVRFIAYPIGGHAPSDPVHMRDFFRRWIDWIEAWFSEVSAGAKPGADTLR